MGSTLSPPEPSTVLLSRLLPLHGSPLQELRLRPQRKMSIRLISDLIHGLYGRGGGVGRGRGVGVCLGAGVAVAVAVGVGVGLGVHTGIW